MQLDDIVRAAEMQDIGMLAVPEAVLNKRGTLEPEDWAMIHRHPLVGERILAAAPASRPSPASCARAMSASTAPATPMGCAARRSRSARA